MSTQQIDGANPRKFGKDMNEIHNDHNVYILGAGFSAPRGLPVISNFMFALRDAHEWHHKQGRNEEVEALKKVIEFRRESMPAAYRVRIDLENIEELFSLASATDDSLSKPIRLAIGATLDFSRTSKSPMTKFEARPNTVPECFSRDPQYVTTDTSEIAHFSDNSYVFYMAALLGALKDGKPKGRNSFVTLNYDLCLEEALSRLRMAWDYGFAPNSVAYHSSSNDLQLNGDIPLLKLHGSLNWTAPEKPEGQSTVYGNYEALRSAGKIPDLVPPTWRKSFTPQLSAVWEQARNTISEATRIVVIGFSIPQTDQHFKYLLAAGLSKNISLREIVFVNPDKVGVLKRAKVLFGDLGLRPVIRFVESGVSQFAGSGAIVETVYGIDRPMHESVGRVQHDWY